MLYRSRNIPAVGSINPERRRANIVKAGLQNLHRFARIFTIKINGTKLPMRGFAERSKQVLENMTNS